MLELQLVSCEHVIHRWHGPIVVLFGCSEQGESHAVCVSDVQPHFWLEVPEGFGDVERVRELLRDLEAFAVDQCPRWVWKAFNRRYEKNPSGGDDVEHRSLIRLQGVKLHERKHFYGYAPKSSTYAYVPVTHPAGLRTLTQLLHAPLRPASLWMSRTMARDVFGAAAASAAYDNAHAVPSAQFRVAEANLEFRDQACASMQITPGQWFCVHEARKSSDKVTNVAKELSCKKKNIRPSDRAGMSPITVMSFDIETLTRDLGHGATAFYHGDDENAKCLSIACVFWRYGEPKEFETTVLSLGDSKDPREAAGEGPADVVWYDDEARMLKHFAELVRLRNPDVVTGYNIFGFDFKWLFARAKALGVLDAFSDMGRLIDWPKTTYDDTIRNGREPRMPVKIPGRIPYDLLVWMKKNRSLREYNLNFVSKTFGEGEKDDVSYNEIGTLFESFDGRVKLAKYCLQDTVLVINLIKNKKLDCLGKDFALSCICGVFVADLMAKGTQHTLRCKLLRLAKDDGFVLPTMSYDNDDDEDASYQGGKVLTPSSGRYTHPVVVFDFESLYPSCMMQHNTCKSTELSLASAETMGMTRDDVNVPPAPSLTGTWLTPDGETSVLELLDRPEEDGGPDKGIMIEGTLFDYENDLNKAIVAGARRAELFEEGYALRWSSGVVWRRRKEDVLCFVKTDKFEGIVPKMERTLKADRKAAKAKMAEAKDAGDEGARVFADNLQNAIKVLMNGAYGGFGTRKGGVFPAGFRIAAAITATGRAWICTVKENVERQFYLYTDSEGQRRVGGLGGAPRPPDAEALRCVYGDTDSVFVHMPGITVEAAAEVSHRISKWFAQNVLKAPHNLEFEKIYWPFLLFKKKLYTGFKFEKKYGPDAEPEVHSRGISAVRRDNALVVRNVVAACLKVVLTMDATPSSVCEWVAQRLVDLKRSVGEVYETPDKLEHFILSAGLSKPMHEYDMPKAATTAAKQLVLLNPTVPVGGNSRVTFVVAATRHEKRADQVLIPQLAARDQPPLDVDYYVGALRKKLIPLISVFFVEHERKAQTVRDVFGREVRVAPKRVCDQNLLPGELEARRRVDARIAELDTRVRKRVPDELRQPYEKTQVVPTAEAAAAKESKAQSTLSVKQWQKKFGMKR